MGNELDESYYNNIFKNSVIYAKEAHDITFYYETWKFAYDFIKKRNIKNIVDLGCGPGHFPSLIEENLNIKYKGYDFSSTAIDQARDKIYNNGNDITFFKQNLSNYSPSFNDNFFVSFEFLEHISFDLEILNSLLTNDEILFSVPSYDDPGHVRCFPNEKDIENRYNSILNLTLLNTKKFRNNTKTIYLYHGIKK